MLNVLAGRLAKDPEVKIVNTKEGERKVSNNAVYVWTGDNNRNNVPVNVSAWGPMADELAKYNKGDTIHFVGHAKDVTYKPNGLDKELYALGYDIKYIDSTKEKLLSETNTFLASYFAKDKDKEKSPEKADEKGKDKEKIKSGPASKKQPPKEPQI